MIGLLVCISAFLSLPKLAVTRFVRVSPCLERVSLGCSVGEEALFSRFGLGTIFGSFSPDCSDFSEGLSSSEANCTNFIFSELEDEGVRERGGVRENFEKLMMMKK
jgi:hypothetical protein